MAIRFETYSELQTIDRSVWDRFAAESEPIMEWDYFRALEASGTASYSKGYRSSHVVAYDGGRPVAIAPLYERDTAWDEFGGGGLVSFLTELTGVPFDRGLVGTVPFTPVPGYQFLHDPEVDVLRAHEMLLNYIDYQAQIRDLASVRFYFLSLGHPELYGLLRRRGFVSLRTSYFMWYNSGYTTFQDFLGTFKSSRRTKVRRELREIRRRGIDISMVPGEEAPARYYELIYKLYVRTWSKHMGQRIRPFLNPGFFRLLGEGFRHRTSFSVASRNGDTVGMALFYRKARRLYGRYWGCFEEVPFLHFATCYYEPIQYAIERGIRTIDPGFGGEHKALRGYQVVPAYHFIKFYGEERQRIAHSVLKQMQV